MTALTVAAIGLPILLALVALVRRTRRPSVADELAADLAAAEAQARADAASGLTAARLRHPSVRAKETR